MGDIVPSVPGRTPTQVAAAPTYAREMETEMEMEMETEMQRRRDRSARRGRMAGTPERNRRS
jgi:hypothetical protein